jgi:hypothetical protein
MLTKHSVEGLYGQYFLVISIIELDRIVRKVTNWAKYKFSGSKGQSKASSMNE